MAPVHNRMPCILKRKNEETYCDPKTPVAEVFKLLHPYDASNMQVVRISARVNNPENDSPQIQAEFTGESTEHPPTRTEAPLPKSPHKTNQSRTDYFKDLVHLSTKSKLGK